MTTTPRLWRGLAVALPVSALLWLGIGLAIVRIYRMV